jgi:1-pyrroline-5-carboxylate dehydrogenase
LYDTFIDAIRERVATIQVGDPAKNFAMGPVINESAKQRILGYIESGKAESRLVAGGNAIETEDAGYYVGPTVFADVLSSARIAQEEIFGPVLAILKADSFDQALKIANDTEYGLTGAVFTEDRERLNIAKHRFHVGNLYFNRKCTGAMVGAHPFGGFNMSGTDSKAGGADYLLLFTQAKSVAERL